MICLKGKGKLNVSDKTGGLIDEKADFKFIQVMHSLAVCGAALIV